MNSQCDLPGPIFAKAFEGSFSDPAFTVDGDDDAVLLPGDGDFAIVGGDDRFERAGFLCAGYVRTAEDKENDGEDSGHELLPDSE